MKCFFYGKVREQENHRKFNGFISFSISDLELVFRAQFKGTEVECQYASLLALLEFIELNPNLFEKRQIEIYGDSFLVIHQVNMKLVCHKEYEPYRNMALSYKRKIDYSLNWIPKNENLVFNQLSR